MPGRKSARQRVRWTKHGKYSTMTLRAPARLPALYVIHRRFPVSDSNYTKNALAASMKKLMRQKPFEKISVSDICADCGINRKSFYYHFRDKYDLVNWIFYVGFMGGIDTSGRRGGWDLLTQICRYFYSEKEFYRSALSFEGQNSLRDYIIEVLQPISDVFLEGIFPGYQEDRFIATFLSDSLLGSVTRWLSGGYGKDIDADQFLERMKEIILRLARDLEEETGKGLKE